MIEQIFDPKTRQHILTTGITVKWQCLEVGAGAGAIAQWLATVVGDSGKVIAVDLDTRFLANIQSSNTILIRTYAQEPRNLVWRPNPYYSHYEIDY